MSECPACRRLHVALQRGVLELRRQPMVLVSEEFHRRLERRIGAEASGFAPLAFGLPAAAALLMSLTLLAAGTLGWEMSRGGPGNHATRADIAPPVVSGIYAPHEIMDLHPAPAVPADWAAAISFDSAELTDQPRAGEFAAAWAGQ